MRAFPPLVIAVLLAGIGAARGSPVDPAKSLLITDLSVVEDARARGLDPWSFGGVASALAEGSGLPAGAWLRAWFRLWSEVREWNGHPVEPRRFERYQFLWPRGSRETFDPSVAPFRLLAVVYRPDVANEEAPDGEFRLVYCAVRPEDRAGLPFQVIFEYRIPGEPRAWAHRWRRLGERPFGEGYNAALAELVAELATRKNFLRARTNDFHGAAVWEMRQFALDSAGRLAPEPLTDTPDARYANEPARAAELEAWIRAREDEVRTGAVAVPEEFRGAAAPVPSDAFRWFPRNRERFAEGVAREFSLRTCNGCHAGETGTIFSHIEPRGARFPAPISPFLRAELPRRAAFLEALTGGARNGFGHELVRRKVH